MKESKISLINLQEQGKSMSNYTRMFRGKMRMSTCRIILITSLAWLLIDVIIIMRYTDGLSGGIFKKSPQSEVSELESAKLFLRSLKGLKVKAWKAARFSEKVHNCARTWTAQNKTLRVNCSTRFMWIMKFVVSRNKSENWWLSRCRLR